MNRVFLIGVVVYFSIVGIFTKDVAAPFLEKEILRILDINKDFESYAYVAAVLFCGLASFPVAIYFAILVKRFNARTK